MDWAGRGDRERSGLAVRSGLVLRNMARARVLSSGRRLKRSLNLLRGSAIRAMVAYREPKRAEAASRSCHSRFSSCNCARRRAR